MSVIRLYVDTDAFKSLDTKDDQSLQRIWRVFTKCGDTVEQGRRLENAIWRVWQRETFCCVEDAEWATGAATAASAPRDIHGSNQLLDSEEAPNLSSSLDSVVEDEAIEFDSADAVDILQPRIRRQDSCMSRGKERHLSSASLKDIFASIVETNLPLTAPLPNIPSPFVVSEPSKSFLLPPEHSNSTSTEPSNGSNANDISEEILDQPEENMAPAQVASTPAIIVRTFPSSLPWVNRITQQSSELPSLSVIPEPTAAPAPMFVQPKKQPAKFALGGSSGSGDSYSDADHSPGVRKALIPPPKKKMFQIGGSSDEDGSLQSPAPPPPKLGTVMQVQKNPNVVHKASALKAHPTSAIVSDDEQSDTDYVDESAIDDDEDSSDWEDSVEESGKSSVEDRLNFKRVDSKANLTSRPSLITLMLANNDRATRLGNNASQSTSAIHRTRTSLNGPSLVASPNDSDEAPLMMKRGLRAPPLRAINEIPRSAAQPIMTTTNGIQHQALSPRTTRRNMLATELTESLRRHLLWERSQKSSVANAVMKRRHTSTDVSNLKQFPERPYMKDGEAPDTQNNGKDTFSGYHEQCW